MFDFYKKVCYNGNKKSCIRSIYYDTRRKIDESNGLYP